MDLRRTHISKIPANGISSNAKDDRHRMGEAGNHLAIGHSGKVFLFCFVFFGVIL